MNLDDLVKILGIEDIKGHREITIKLKDKHENDIQNKENIKEIRQTKHIYEDFISNKEKKREYLREYYIQNKDRMKENSRKYFTKNKEKIKAYKREDYSENKEKKKKSNREYRIQNKEKWREYYLKNKEKIKEANKKYRIQNNVKIKETIREYRLLNKDKKKEFDRKYYLQNKEKIKLLYIQKNIERNNGIYNSVNSWKTNESIREYFERIAPLLHISDLSDWYRISRSQIVHLKGMILTLF